MRSQDLIARMKLDASPFDKSLKQAQADLQAFSRVAGAVPGQGMFRGLASDAGALLPVLSSVPLGIAAIGTALAGAGIAARSAGVDFEASLAKITTLGPDAEQSLGRTRQAILDTFSSVAVTGSVSDLAEANYLLQSSGRSAAEAIEDLRTAAEASVAGYTSVTTAVDGLTTVTNAWKDSQISTQRASDVLFSAVNVGKASFDDIAQSIGLVAPLAASAGVRFEEVAAATALLSNQGVRTSSIMEGLRSAISNIVNPTEKFKKEFGALAQEFGASRLQRDGLIQFLTDFQRESGGSRQALSALFSDISGQSAVLGLLKNGGQDAAAALKQMETSAGAADRALDKVNATAKAQDQLIRNQISATWTTFGEALVRFTLPAVEKLSRLLNDVSDNAAFAKRDVTLLLAKSGSEFQTPAGLSGRGFDQANALRGVVTQFRDSPEQFLGSISNGQLRDLIKELERLKASGRFEGNARTAIPPEMIERLKKSLEYRDQEERDQGAAEALAEADRRIAARKTKKDETDATRRANAAVATREREDKAKELERQRASVVKEAEDLTSQLQAKAVEAVQGTAGALQETMLKVLSEGAALLKSGVLSPELSAQLTAQLETFEALQTEMVTAEQQADATRAAIDGALSQDTLPATEALAARERELLVILEGTQSLAARKKYEEQLTQLAKARGEATENLFVLPNSNQLDKHIAQLGDLAQQLATIGDKFGILPRRAVDAVRGVGALVEQGKKLSDALKPNSGVGTLGKVGIGIGIAAGVASLVASALGDSPEEKARKDTMRANTEALRALTANIGDLANATVSGGAVGRARSFLNSADVLQLLAPRGIGTGWEAGAVTIRSFGNTGTSLKELQEVAAALGLTLDGTIGSFRQLREAVNEKDLNAYLKTFAGSVERLQDTITADGITDPIEILRRRVATLSAAETGFPALAKALQDVDLTSVEGRGTALDRVRALFDQVQSGRLGLDQFGGLSLTDARRELLNLITSLRDTTSGGAAGTGGFNETRSITEVTGARLASLLGSANMFLSGIALDVTAIRAAMVTPAPISLMPPSLGSISTAGGGNALIGALSVVVNVTLTYDALHGGTADSLTRGSAIGSVVGDKVLEAIDRGLQERVLRARLMNGNNRLTT